MINKLGKIKRYTTNLISVKPSDVYIVSFPKSGNTWVRFYLCNLLNNLPSSHFTNDVISFKILDQTMPELGLSDLRKPWPHENFPRIIKTHLKYNVVMGNHKNILVLRDPKDVMISYFNFEKTKVSSKFKGNTLSNFIRDSKLGINAWCRHYLSWKEQDGIIIKYEELKEKDVDIFLKLNEYLGISCAEDIFLKSVMQSRFESIKKLEAEKGLADPSKVGDGFKFARSGKTGQWKDLFSENDLEYVAETLEKYQIRLYI